MSFFKLGQAAKTGGAQEGVHYKLIKDGHGVEHRIINFENPEICRREGLVELVAAIKTKRHDNYLSFTRLYDKENDIIIAIPIGIDSDTKNLRFERITLRDDEVFNLSNMHDAMVWTVLKNNPYVQGSPTQVKEEFLKYKIFDKEKEAEIFLSKINVKKKAASISEGLFGSQLRDMAISIGLNADNMSQAIMSMEVIKFAEKEPKKFMDIWDNPTRQELTIIKKALLVGVLTVDPMLGICFGGLPLGTSEPQAVEYIKNNVNLAISLQQRIEEKESGALKAMGIVETKPLRDVKDVKIAELERQLEDMKKANEKIANTKIESVVEEIGAPIIVADEELAQLLIKAKALKIRGAHLIKDKESLKEKIAEKEKELGN